MSLEALSDLASLQLPIIQPDQEGARILSGESKPSIISAGPPPTRTRQTSNGINSRGNSSDWARQVSLEERLYIRDKMKAAYRKRATTYDELVETCAALEEELIFSSAPSRLDYFKTGVQYEKRVAEKISQVRSYQANIVIETGSTSDYGSEMKRSRTDLK